MALELDVILFAAFIVLLVYAFSGLMPYQRPSELGEEGRRIKPISTV